MRRHRVMILGVEPQGYAAIRLALSTIDQPRRLEIVDAGELVDSGGDGQGLTVVCDLDGAGESELATLQTAVQYSPRVAVVLATENPVWAAAFQAIRRQGVAVMQKLPNWERTAEHLAQHVRSAVPPLDKLVVGQSAATRAVRDAVNRLACVSCNVLISGETGVGKELVAQALHAYGLHADLAVVTINCAATPPQRLEAVWQEAVAAARLGASSPDAMRDQSVATRDGVGNESLSAADGTTFAPFACTLAPGTIVFDRVDELPLDAQTVLLRLLDDAKPGRPATANHGDGGEGDGAPRLVFTASTSLTALADEGQFRRDLLFRIRVATIDLLPLRERRDDVVALAHHFVAALAPSINPRVTAVAPAALHALSAYSWPGNVRELRNVMEHALLICSGGEIQVQHLLPEVQPAHRQPAHRQPAPAEQPVAADESRLADHGGQAEWHVPDPPDAGSLPHDLKEAVRAFERMVIVRAIQACNGNRDQAARWLNISKATLYRKLDGHRPLA